MVTGTLPRQRAERWRARVRAEVRAAADPLPAGDWSTAGAARVTLSEYLVARMDACPAAAVAERDDEFAWSAAKAARTLAVAGLREMTTAPQLAPLAAIDRAADDPAAVGTGLADWIACLEPGGRTAVLQRAATLCTAVREQLHRWPPAGSWYEPATRLRPTSIEGRPVRITARFDLRAGRRTATDDTTRFAVIDAAAPAPGRAELLAGHLALAATLAEGSVPEAVTLLHVRTGWRTHVPATDDLLDEALDRCVEAVAAYASAREGVAPEPRPGSGCRFCRCRTSCGPGQAWLAGPGRRQGGLLPEQA